MGIGDQIKQTLCFDFEQLTEDDMKKPLVSITCAAILVETASGDVPKQKEPKGQCEYYKKAAGIKQKYATYCEKKAEKIPSNVTNSGDQADCFRCSLEPTDFAFVLDESQSISSQYVLITSILNSLVLKNS